MITQDTLFILGAGASCPYGFPTGQGLREYIFSPGFREKLKHVLSEFHLPGSPELFRELGSIDRFTSILEGTPAGLDVDQFLALNSNNEFCLEFGKALIATSIRYFETISCFGERVRNFESEDWYSFLFKRMTKEFSTPDDLGKFSKNKVSFITFNYDRSLEHFIYSSLINSFDSQKEKIKSNPEEYINFPIIHVYGQIDQPEWRGGVEYQAALHYRHFRDLRHNIHIVGENTSTKTNELAELLQKAQRIFFLGFAYAKENLKVLNINSHTKNKQIFGTALEFTEREIRNIKKELMNEDQNIIIENLNCYSLLREYL